MPQLYFDPTGFPAVGVGPGLRAGLLPVCRVQVEAYLGASTDPAAADGLLPDAPRVSWRAVSAATVGDLFATGVDPAAVDRFARWVGPGYRLPTAAEWRAVDKAFAAEQTPPDRLRAVTADPRCHPAARAILDWLVRHRPGTGWANVGLFQGGLMEWVADGTGGHGLFGRPPPELFRVILNPQLQDPVRPRNPRNRAFGFRLVRAS